MEKPQFSPFFIFFLGCEILTGLNVCLEKIYFLFQFFVVGIKNKFFLIKEIYLIKFII